LKNTPKVPPWYGGEGWEYGFKEDIPIGNSTHGTLIHGRVSKSLKNEGGESAGHETLERSSGIAWRVVQNSEIA